MSDDLERIRRKHAQIEQDALFRADMIERVPKTAATLAGTLVEALDRADWPAAGIALKALRDHTDELADRLVLEMRLVGRSWGQVAEVLGTSRQAAHERYRHLDG